MRLGVCVAFVAAMAVPYGVRAQSAGDTVIHACIHPGNLQLRLVKAGEGCKPQEQAIRWNVSGPQGLKGDKGDKGDAGPAGPKGDTGDRGLDGAPGANGAPGADGARGADGAPGAKGDKGDKGDAGAAGARGEKGDKGDAGPAGPKGDTGDRGPAGAPGADGARGADGATGAKGDKGDKGDAGAAGTQGEKGEPGAQGPQGEPGPQGPAGAAAPDPWNAAAQDERLATLPAGAIVVTMDGVSRSASALGRVGFDIDVRPVSTGLDVVWEQVAPGAPHIAPVRFTFDDVLAVTAFRSWMNAYVGGQASPKDIEIKAVDAADKLLWTVLLQQSRPMSVERDFAGRSIVTVQPQTLGIAVGSLQVPVGAFAIESGGPVGSGKFAASAGGAIVFGTTSTTAGSDQQQQFAVGKKSVTPLVVIGLRLSAPLGAWIQDALHGQDYLRTVSLEPGDGTHLTYTDAFLTRVNIFNPAGPGITQGVLLPYVDLTVTANEVAVSTGPLTIK